MTISQRDTTTWIKQNAESAGTYSYADVCTLIHMAKNEENSKFLHDSILDEKILAGYSNYSYLNDDEVRTLINYFVNLQKETDENVKNLEINNLKNEYKLKIQENNMNDTNKYLNDILKAVNNIKYDSV